MSIFHKILILHYRFRANYVSFLICNVVSLFYFRSRIISLIRAGFVLRYVLFCKGFTVLYCYVCEMCVTYRRVLDWMITFIALIHLTRNYN
jgi:hypothetical protein